MKTMILKDLVKDTYTNASGASLAIQLRDCFSKDKGVQVSLKDSTPISSSFFNSSFGELIEEFGFDTIKRQLKLIDVSTSQGKLLRMYFDAYRDHHTC